MRLQAKGLELLGGRFDAGGIEAAVELSGDGQACLSCGGANKVEDFLIAIERLACPVFRDL